MEFVFARCTFETVHILHGAINLKPAKLSCLIFGIDECLFCRHSDNAMQMRLTAPPSEPNCSRTAPNPL